MKKTGAQIIVKLLEMQGITTVAGIPGGSILPLYDELYKSGIRHILVRQEQAAGFVAQGMARTTGRPAVCLATSGPGAMNLLTAIADARSDSIPVVAITGQVNTALIGTDAFQEADTFGLSFPITKHSIMVKSPEELLTAVPAAFSIAMAGRPGPVLIDVPRDIQTASCEFDDWPELSSSNPYKVRFRTPESDIPALLRKFCDLLLHSRRPVLYVGGGCNSPAGAQSLRRFLELFRIPVVTSLTGIPVVPRSYTGNLGMVGMHGMYAADCAVHDSDLVFAAGARFDDRAVGLAEKFCPDAKILQIDIDAAEVNKIFEADYAVVAELERTLPLLNEFLQKALDDSRSGQRKSSPVSEKAAAAREQWFRTLVERKESDGCADCGRPSSGSGLPNPRSFIAQLPANAEKGGLKRSDIIVATDVGQHQMWTAQYFPFEAPRTFLTSGSLGTMGFGLPAAIGAALANPEKRIICISGDGSLLMNIQELATLAEQNCAVTVIVFENGTLGMVRQQQKLLFEKKYSASEFTKNPDFGRLAQAFGIRFADANENPEWYKTAFTAQDGIRPCLVRLRIDPEEDVLPHVLSGKPNIEALR
ncbi:MAG: biosynthetic-type acetolactate synthase large subunit [Treponema sp.]|jgi:acetolactate synthase-1/2/3 large subunit|nr:biosynthetic-type acetolactate synthase large subunit [Treponema sp.]